MNYEVQIDEALMCCPAVSKQLLVAGHIWKTSVVPASFNQTKDWVTEPVKAARFEFRDLNN